MHNRETDKQRALHTSLRIHHGSRPPCVRGRKQNGHDAELTERGMMDDAAETRPGGCWAGDAHHRGSPRGGPAGAAPARKAPGPPHDGPPSQAPSPQVCSTKPPALERRRGRARAAVFRPPSWTLQPQAPPDARHSGCPGGFTARCLFPERRPSPPFCPEAPALAIALGSAGPVCSKPAGVTHCVHCPLCFLTPHCRAPGKAQRSVGLSLRPHVCAGSAWSGPVVPCSLRRKAYSWESPRPVPRAGLWGLPASCPAGPQALSGRAHCRSHAPSLVQEVSPQELAHSRASRATRPGKASKIFRREATRALVGVGMHPA